MKERCFINLGWEEDNWILVDYDTEDGEWIPIEEKKK